MKEKLVTLRVNSWEDFRDTQLSILSELLKVSDCFEIRANEDDSFNLNFYKEVHTSP